MLWIFKNKLCPLLSLAIATISCGKKMSEGLSPEGNRSIEIQELPSALVLTLASTESHQKIYRVPKNANLMLPETLRVTSGDPIGQSVTITYNFDEIQNLFDYQCTYKSTFTTTELPLDKCTNFYGEVFSDVLSFQFPIYHEKIIKIETTADDLTFDAVYTVDWK